MVFKKTIYVERPDCPESIFRVCLVAHFYPDANILATIQERSERLYPNKTIYSSMPHTTEILDGVCIEATQVFYEILHFDTMGTGDPFPITLNDLNRIQFAVRSQAPHYLTDDEVRAIYKYQSFGDFPY